MAARIEWRTKGKGDDALLFVREFGEAGDTVLKTWGARPGPGKRVKRNRGAVHRA